MVVLVLVVAFQLIGLNDAHGNAVGNELVYFQLDGGWALNSSRASALIGWCLALRSLCSAHALGDFDVAPPTVQLPTES